MTKGAVLAISHGGGPLPVLGDPSHASITSSLRHRAPAVLGLGTPDAPRAIVVVTAHWSTEKVTVSAAPRHDLYYDYGGFPPESYELRYDAPGEPGVAAEVARVMAEEGLDVEMDDERGWDHGLFIPFLLINPQATVPLVQVSVLASESPQDHLRMGLALSRLRSSNVAVVGSGFASFHNLSLMMRLGLGSSSSQPSPSARGILDKVSDWNDDLVGAARGSRSANERRARFEGWRGWRGSFTAHPLGGGEHFLPLVVCVGAADEESGGAYKDEFLGVDIWTFYWGGHGGDKEHDEL